MRLTDPPKHPKVLPRRGVDAEIIDVSVTGMAIDAPDAKRLQRGVVVRVTAPDAEGDVVRHITREGRTAHLGVQLLDSHSRFAQWTYALARSADDRGPGRGSMERGAL